MLTSGKNRQARGWNDPLIWSLMLCAVAVAVGAFILLKNRPLEPIGGFGGPDTWLGFPPVVGSYRLTDARLVVVGAALPEHLAATYEKPGIAPIHLSYFPLADGDDPGEWLNHRVGDYRAMGFSESRRGEVTPTPTGGKTLPREGSYVWLHGPKTGDPEILIWTQMIAGKFCGFSLSAPTPGDGLALRSLFKRETAPTESSTP